MFLVFRFSAVFLYLFSTILFLRSFAGSCLLSLLSNCNQSAFSLRCVLCIRIKCFPFQKLVQFKRFCASYFTVHYKGWQMLFACVCKRWAHDEDEKLCTKILMWVEMHAACSCRDYWVQCKESVRKSERETERWANERDHKKNIEVSEDQNWTEFKHNTIKRTKKGEYWIERERRMEKRNARKKSREKEAEDPAIIKQNTTDNVKWIVFHIERSLFLFYFIRIWEFQWNCNKKYCTEFVLCIFSDSFVYLCSCCMCMVYSTLCMSSSCILFGSAVVLFALLLVCMMYILSNSIYS